MREQVASLCASNERVSSKQAELRETKRLQAEAAAAVLNTTPATALYTRINATEPLPGTNATAQATTPSVPLVTKPAVTRKVTFATAQPTDPAVTTTQPGGQATAPITPAAVPNAGPATALPTGPTTAAPAV